MLLLIFNDMLEDFDGVFIAELLELGAVVGDVTAFVDFKAAEKNGDSADVAPERACVAAGPTFIDRIGTAEMLDSLLPEGGVFELRGGEMAQALGASGVGVAVGDGLVSVVAGHLGLPVGFESSE